jgi:hypothetical protein
MAYYTPKQRKLIAAEYRTALKMLPAVVDSFDGSPYICDNIWERADWRPPRTHLFSAKHAAADTIAERIEHSFSLESWLKSQSGEIREQVRDDVNYNRGRKLQAYRLAWLKQLIKEFEGK